MRFTKTHDSMWSKYYWQGKKNNFVFKVSKTNKLNMWFVCVSHNKLDIRYNSLWERIEFDRKENAMQWCEDFNHRNFKCLGDGKERIVS